jgi:hypothetical protein
MSASPINPSFLSNNKFEFVIERLPQFTFYVQGINVPSISMSPTQIPSPWTQMYMPSNQLTYEQIQVTYTVDEDMKSWFELYNWMTNLGNPETLDKLGTLTSTPGKVNSAMSDATLIAKTNANNANIKFTFVDMFPIELTGFQFGASEGHDFQSTVVTFAYTYMKADYIV